MERNSARFENSLDPERTFELTITAPELSRDYLCPPGQVRNGMLTTMPVSSSLISPFASACSTSAADVRTRACVLLCHRTMTTARSGVWSECPGGASPTIFGFFGQVNFCVSESFATGSRQ